MTIALRRQLQQHALPNVSFGPFRFFEAMPWLVLAASMRVIRNALWQFYQTSPYPELIKNLIFFVFIFSFALLRLWVTLLVLTFGLKQSYLRAG